MKAAFSLALIFCPSGHDLLAQGPYNFQKVDILGTQDLTHIYGINSQGKISGLFRMGSVLQGFVAESDLSGLVVVSDSDEADTSVFGINSSNVICGLHLMNPLKSFTALPPYSELTDLPLSNAFVQGITDDGTVAGFFDDRSLRGFILSPSGVLTTIDVDGTGTTTALGINNRGQTVGVFGGSRLQSFLRDADGSISHFDFPGSLLTYPQAIDDAGNIVGWFDLDNGDSSGFWRSADGKTNLIIEFPGNGVQNIRVLGINNAGQLVGTFFEGSGDHGFIATPTHGSDTTPPIVIVSGTTNDSPPRLTVYVQDTGSGLASLTIQQNPSAVVDPFVPGTTDPVRITASSGTLVITAKDVAGTKIRFLPIDVGASIGGSIHLSSTNYHFAPHQAGDTGGPGHIYIANTIAAPVTLSFALQDGRDFAITGNTCGTSLQIGASCEVFFTFSPPGPGNFTDSLIVGYNVPGGPQVLQLSGSGLGSGLTVSPGNFSFAGHPVGETSGPGKIFLHNFGSDPLAILSAALGGAAAADFQVVSTTCLATLPAYETCSYTLAATPTETGFRYATLTIASSWNGSPQTVTLQTFGR